MKRFLAMVLALLMLLLALLSVVVGILLARRDREDEIRSGYDHPADRKRSERKYR